MPNTSMPQDPCCSSLRKGPPPPLEPSLFSPIRLLFLTLSHCSLLFIEAFFIFLSSFCVTFSYSLVSLSSPLCLLFFPSSHVYLFCCLSPLFLYLLLLLTHPYYLLISQPPPFLYLAPWRSGCPPPPVITLWTKIKFISGLGNKKAPYQLPQ